MHDGMPYGRNQDQGHSREVDRQSPTGLIFFSKLIRALMIIVCVLQVGDLSDAVMPMSKLAYWQSEALSRDLSTQVGSQSQLNARQLLSCPSLLAAALVSDPAMVIVPLQQPPKQSAVVDWLRQLNYAQPADHKGKASGSKVLNTDTESTSVASNSEHPAVYDKTSESANVTVIDVENQQRKNLRSEKLNSDLVQQNDDDGEDDDGGNGGDYDDNELMKKQKKLSMRRRRCRVSFQADNINRAESVAEKRARIEHDAENELAAATTATDDDDDDDDGDDDSCKVAEGTSPVSDSSSILLCSESCSAGRPLVKASFIDVEVPDSWKAHRQSQTSLSSRSSGDLPPVITTVSPAVPVGHHLASTPTISNKGRRDNELVDLSVISCSPITPRNTSDLVARTRSRERAHSGSVEAGGNDEDDDDDDVTAVPCTPITPSSTSDQQQSVKNRSCGAGVESHDNGADEDDDITIIPCTPVTPDSSQTAKNSSCGKRLVSSPGGVEYEEQEVLAIPCSPVAPTTTLDQTLKKNAPQTNVQRISHSKVVFTTILALIDWLRMSQVVLQVTSQSFRC